MEGIIYLLVIVLMLCIVIAISASGDKGDDTVSVKSRAAVDKYDYLTYLREDKNRVQLVENVLENKQGFKLIVSYVSPAGRARVRKKIEITPYMLDRVKSNPNLLKTAAEIKAEEKLLKALEKQNDKNKLESKQADYYSKVNEVFDLANKWKDKLIIKEDKDELDKMMKSLFDRTVNSIKRIKNVDSEEWRMIEDYILGVHRDTQNIIDRNLQIIDYYYSDEFAKLKETCGSLMGAQKEFNEYIEEKAKSISELFGTRIIRNETENDDKYNYIRPYKKTITPFTAEVSNAVFASAENNPIDYIVKYFYPNKSNYPMQIQKLQLLIGELETLKDAKRIIDDYKNDYQQYLNDVPNYIMTYDQDGFYEKLGFANVSESVLAVEYRFVYTSNGGMAQRYFSVPMTEETIVALIEALENKLSFETFTREQRALMTTKLRNHIKERDDYTCQICGNSTYKEPNLLLEIDHIKPVSKGGYTVEDNLQTLCWKCNRAKSNKMKV